MKLVFLRFARRYVALRVALLVIVASMWLVLALVIPSATRAASDQTHVAGFVYYDLNGNGQWDTGELRAPGARVVSAQDQIQYSGPVVYADATGNYSFDVNNPTSLYPYIFEANGMNRAGKGLGIFLETGVGVIRVTIMPQQTNTVNIGLRYPPNTSTTCDNYCIYGEWTPQEAGFGLFVARRGGRATFGQPISNVFLFLGFPTQIYQRAVLQHWPDGSVHMLNLLDSGLMPFTSFNGATVPSYDPSLAAVAPSPGSTDYSAQVFRFVKDNTPDAFAGAHVGFGRKFFNTVSLSAAFPSGDGDPNLLSGFDLELWGVPTSRPMADPNNNQFIYQRFQRGIMHYQGNLGVTDGLLLGEYFKAVLTGQHLPPDLAVEAQGSSFLRQYCDTEPSWVCRSQQLDPVTTDLTGAFEPQVP